MKDNSIKTYIIDLRNQGIGHIIPQLITNINYYFNDYNINKEDCICQINLFENDILCIHIKLMYIEYSIFNSSLTAIIDYNEFYYNKAEILQLIYSLFNSINIYGIMEG